MSTTVDPAGTTTVPAGGPAWGTTWPVLDGFRALARSRVLEEGGRGRDGIAYRDAMAREVSRLAQGAS